MNIIELIRQLKTVEEAEELMNKELPGIDYDAIDTYMVGQVDMNAEIVFFDAENVPHGNVIEVDGITYENLFPLGML
jgi:hypothetical protein